MMVNPPRMQGATLSAWMEPEVYPSAAAAHMMTSFMESFSPVRTCARYAPPAADAPDDPIPEQGRIPLVILTSRPKSAPALLRTSAAAMVTEFLAGSRVMLSDPGPCMSEMTIPDGIFLPSIMS